MKCDKCGVALNVSNSGDYAPYGIPMYVCKSCYNKLKEGKKNESEYYDRYAHEKIEKR